MRWFITVRVPDPANTRPERSAAFFIAGSEELRTARRRGECHESDSIFHVDFKQPKELEFNRARLRRALCRSGAFTCVTPDVW